MVVPSTGSELRRSARAIQRMRRVACALPAAVGRLLMAGMVAISACGAEPQALDKLGDPLPQNARVRLGTVRFRHPGSVVELGLSPDEKTIVTCGRSLIAWDTASGRERWRAELPAHGLADAGACYGMQVFSFTKDGRQFVTPGLRNQVVFWDTATGTREILTVNAAALTPLRNDDAGAIGPARSVDLSPDQTRLAFGSAVGLIVCDLQGKLHYQELNLPEKPISPEAGNADRLLFGGHYSYGRFSPDGRLLAAVTSDRPDQIRLLDAATGRRLRSIDTTARVVRMAFSPDSRQLAVTERDSAIRLYSVDDGAAKWSVVLPLQNPYENYTSAVTYSLDGKTIAAAATDNRIYLLHAESGDIRGTLTGHSWYPWSLAFTADGRQMYSAGWDGPIRRWDPQTLQQAGPPMGIHGSPVVATSPDGNTLAWCDDKGVLRLVSVSDQQQTVLSGEANCNLTQLTFSADGALLAAGGGQGDHIVVVVWRLSDGSIWRQWQWPKGRDPHSHVEAIDFSPDGHRLAAAVFRQSAAHVWDLPADRQLAVLKHTQVYGLSFSPDGATLATAGWDQQIRFWEAETGRLQREFNSAGAADRRDGGDRRMYAVRYAGSGEMLATAHLDGSVRVWNSDDMSLRTTFPVSGGFVYGSLDFSADGRWLATGSASGNIEVWDASAGHRVCEVGRHQGNVYTVAFSRDSRRLISGGDDGIAVQWTLQQQGSLDKQNISELWSEFISDDQHTSFQARWGLLEQPDLLVETIADRLRPVRIVIDLEAALQEASSEQKERRRRMILQLVEKEAQTELLQTVRRSVALLSELRTADSIRLLQELSERSDSVVGALAEAVLHQAEGVNDN